jgi:hypothetical protein
MCAVRRKRQGCPFGEHSLREEKRRFLVTFCRRTKSYPLAAGQRKLLLFDIKKIEGKELDSGFRRNDELRKSKGWIPAFARMTS